jgi:hypothetical protein
VTIARVSAHMQRRNGGPCVAFRRKGCWSVVHRNGDRVVSHYAVVTLFGRTLDVNLEIRQWMPATVKAT